MYSTRGYLSGQVSTIDAYKHRLNQRSCRGAAQSLLHHQWATGNSQTSRNATGYLTLHDYVSNRYPVAPTQFDSREEYAHSLPPFGHLKYL